MRGFPGGSPFPDRRFTLPRARRRARGKKSPVTPPPLVRERDVFEWDLTPEEEAERARERAEIERRAEAARVKKEKARARLQAFLAQKEEEREVARLGKPTPLYPSSCCGVETRPEYVGASITRRRCGQCGREQG